MKSYLSRTLLLSTASSILPSAFAMVNDTTNDLIVTRKTVLKGTDSGESTFFWQEDESFEVDESTTDDLTVVKGFNWVDSGTGIDASFFGQEDESVIVISGDGPLRLSVSDSDSLCKEEDINFIEDFFNTDEEQVGEYIKPNGEPVDQLACLVDEVKVDYGDDVTTELILEELMSTSYLESCDREDLDECSENFPIVKEVIDIVMDLVIPYLLEDISDECQYEYKKVYGKKYGPCLAGDNSFTNELNNIIVKIDFENDDADTESNLAVIELFGLITDKIGAPLALSDENISINCDGDQSQRRLVFFLVPLLIKGAVGATKLAIAAKKSTATIAAAKAVSKKASIAIKGKGAPKLIKGVQSKIKGQVKKGPKKKTVPKKKTKKNNNKKTRKPTRKPTQEPSKSPTQSPTSQPSSSANPSSSSQPSMIPSVSDMPSSSGQPSYMLSSSGQPSSSKPSVGKLQTSKSSKKTKSKSGKAKCSKSKAGSLSFGNSKSGKKDGATSGKAKSSKSKAGSGYW